MNRSNRARAAATLGPAQTPHALGRAGAVFAALVMTAVLPLLEGCAAALVGAGAATTAVVANDRRTAGTMMDDESIEWKARAALGRNEKLWNESHISVTSYNQVVLLTGETPSEEMRTEATRLVRQVDKVRGVHNELQVAAPSAMLSRSSDTYITSKVKSSLVADTNVPGTRIKVVTEAGTVYLMGLVSPEEGDAATEVTRQVGGVQRVVKLFEYLDKAPLTLLPGPTQSHQQ
ncbi:MAG: BON domain-containing protein [Gammaproteobacteria bacterium]|nr:BON domain-containing protein [Gammaproteobacteria bacterium]NIR82276.1 BON domain-containing protein [Gammaproteobacteria bacterium]NIR91207.1 BON domain-containing protein [Gammaproteobacteria bacterium]NIU03425.1 BON domain-containing protein [Gammaproteobacteria bacterium]NIX84700.1 BON domain-containing protein [Gammaproteobacteria bacterium]